MGQYQLKLKEDEENLKRAITQYPLDSIKISPRRFVNNFASIDKCIYENLKKKKLEFTKENGLTFYVNNEKLFNFPLNKNEQGFKIEYQNNKYMRLWTENFDPNNPFLPKPKYSTLRKIVDDLLLEIYFIGKIKIEQKNPSSEYWQIS